MNFYVNTNLPTIQIIRILYALFILFHILSKLFVKIFCSQNLFILKKIISLQILFYKF